MRNLPSRLRNKTAVCFSPVLLLVLTIVACQHHGRAHTGENSSGPSELIVTKPSEREIVMTRVFDAPQSLVFDALTKPELIKRWYAPAGCSLETCEIDLQPGGHWRFVVQLPQGKKMEMRGVYHEVTLERLLYTETYDNSPLELLVTEVLHEENGRTTMTVTVLHPSQQARNENFAGIVQGSQQIYDRLAEVLASMDALGSKGN